MQFGVRFYVLLGTVVLGAFLTGCADDTAIYQNPQPNAHSGEAPPEEPPPATSETTTTTTTTETSPESVPTETKTPPPVNPTQPKPWQPAPNTTGGTTTPAPVSYPKASRVPGKANRVISPYAPYAGEVDVGGFSAGQEVKCPYTGKIFIVP